MRKIVFATNNRHKLDELRRIVAAESLPVSILSLADIGCTDDLPETCDTLAGNAAQKAEFVRSHYGYECFADDTGLMVDALGGEPGVRSARYAPGEGHDSAANMKLLLTNLQGIADRRAHFSTVIALAEGSDGMRLFEGRVDGRITAGPRGDGGFGYDPVFEPDEAGGLTFAQMDADAKNAISHRGRATARLMEYLTGR